MVEIAGICELLKASFDGDAWHGPAVRELLEGITPAQAATRPAAGVHSIWELVFHIAAWENAARRMLAGETGDVPPELNFPKMPAPGEESWRQAREALDAAHEALMVAVSVFPGSRLGESVPGKPFTFYQLLHGVVHHNLYHAGQIAVLKKAVAVRAAHGA